MVYWCSFPNLLIDLSPQTHTSGFNAAYDLFIVCFVCHIMTAAAAAAALLPSVIRCHASQLLLPVSSVQHLPYLPWF